MISIKNRLSDTAKSEHYSTLLVGESAAMQEVFRLINRVGPTDAAVLLTGESGSGKDLVAQEIHARSARHAGPFITINCGSIPVGLIEAELFGAGSDVVGGTATTRPGVFERARGGTLFLDEITEMPFEMQSRLLRVLETRTFYQSSTATELVSDVRVIAATNKSPLWAVQSGQLREDLLYRLAVFPIELPPLRERGSDVELLADHFLVKLNDANHTHKRLSAQSRMTLKHHGWPGNVRELRNCIERAHILNDLVLELAPIQAVAGMPKTDTASPERLDIRVGSRIYDMERSLIVATLDYFQGNKRRAADALGCSLKTLYNKLNGYSQSQECTSG